ncbi:19831_t:CDS:2 [Gigaspora margarita]|uniref:19831_t:CDS:1 n=1 Tax=Gigaspora margarita TaxID=4874 RepID=A0ABN7V5V8_GIGMA|nr:19831_t:CDS:2 [Gigaspora margarita]
MQIQKYATKKYTMRKIESDSSKIKDNIDAEFFSSELLETDNIAKKKKIANANSKHATKKQAIKKIKYDSVEVGDDIDAKLFSFELPEVNYDTSTELFAPFTQSKKTTVSNQLSMQVQQSGNNSEKKRMAKANLKCATKKNKQ